MSDSQFKLAISNILMPMRLSLPVQVPVEQCGYCWPLLLLYGPSWCLRRQSKHLYLGQSPLMNVGGEKWLVWHVISWRCHWAFVINLRRGATAAQEKNECQRTVTSADQLLSSTLECLQAARGRSSVCLTLSSFKRLEPISTQDASYQSSKAS